MRLQFLHLPHDRLGQTLWSSPTNLWRGGNKVCLTAVPSPGCAACEDFVELPVVFSRFSFPLRRFDFSALTVSSRIIPVPVPALPREPQQ